jgi:hypothetical protein
MWGESDLPHFSALFVALILIFLNLMSIPAAIDAITGGHLISDSNRNKLILGGVGLIISLISYYFLVHGEKYKRIAEEFSDETPTQRKKRLLGIWLYLVGSFGLFFGLLALRDS